MTDLELAFWMGALVLAGLIGLPLILVVLFMVAKFILGIGHQGLTERARWSMYDEDGEPRGVVVIDEEWQGHPDYHAPDKVYKYRQEK